MKNQTKTTDNHEISNKKFCTKCGTELNSEAVICPSCCAEQKDVAEAQDDKKIINKIKKHKKLLIICSGVLIVIIGIIVAVSIISYRSSLEYIAKTVKDEYPRAHYEVSYTGMSVTFDINPDDETAYDIYNMTTTELAVFQAIQSGSTNGIKLMNEKLGFDSDLFEQMNKTTSSMGEKTAENDNYRVEWSYSATEGLEVTYYEK